MVLPNRQIARSFFGFAVPGLSGQSAGFVSRFTQSLAGAVLLVLLTLFAVVANAANTWNAPIGSGNWDTTTTNWLSPTTWTNGDDAIFGGLSTWESLGNTAANENITISTTGIQAGSLTFNYTGISVAGTSTNILTLTGTGNITTSQKAESADTTWASGNSYVNTISAPIAGSVGLTKLGVGALNLTGTNTYSGTTLVSAGILRLNSAAAINGGVGATGGLSALTINGGVVELESIGNFSRDLGAGDAQFQITGGTSGFSARGGARTLNIGGAAAPVQWGSASFAPTTLVLNAFTANNQLIVSNGIDLNGATRTIRSDSVGTSARATISGVINDGLASGAGLTKTGTGLLELSSTGNTYTGTTTVNGGVLRLSSANALPGGIGATGGTSALTLNGGVLELATGDFQRAVGTGSDQFQITGGISGFSARTAIRTVDAGGASATLTWGSATFNPSILLLNDVTNDNQLNINNPINLNGATRTIAVNGMSSFANIVGEISDSVGGGGLNKIGPGILKINTPVSYTGRTTVRGGTLNPGANNVLGDNAPLTVAFNDGENSSLGGGTFASIRANSTAGNGASPGAGWARFDMAGFSDTVGTVTVDGNNTFLIGGGGTLTSTGSFEIRGGQILAALAGTGINLNKSGGGLALLDPQTGSSGANTPMSNTYTGTTTISGGVLRIFNVNAIPGGIATAGGLSALTINGGVLEMGYDRTNAVVGFSRDLGNTSSTFQITGGRSGFSAWNGARTVNIGGAGATVTWGSTYFNPSILVLNESSAGKGASESSNSTLTLANALDLNTSGTARTIDVMANHTTALAAFISGNITDSGSGSGLTKTGVGVLMLSGTANTYAGVTTVKTGGGIQIQNNNALGATGAGNNTVVEAGGTLRLDNVTTPEAITLNGTGIVNNSFQMLANTNGIPTGMYQPTTLGAAGGNTGALRNISGPNTINGLVTLASASRIQSESGTTLALSGGVTGSNVDLTVSGSGDTSIATLTTGSGKLKMDGFTAGSTSGTLNLTGASTYTGKTTVRKGTINVATTGSINGATGTALDFTGNGIFKVTETSQNMTALTFSNGDGTVYSSRTAGTLTQAFASYTAPAAGKTATFITDGGVIGTDNKIVLTTGQGTGFMGKNVFANSASGVTTGNRYAFYDAGGFVRAHTTGDANFFASSAGATMGASSTDNVELAGAITAQTTTAVNTINLGANAFAVVAADTVSTDGLLSTGGSFGPNTSFLQTATSGGELNVQVPSGTLTIQSVIQSNGASTLTKSGAGILTISTAPTYTGKTTVASGTLNFSASTLGTLPSTEIVVDSGDLGLPASDYFVGNNVLAGGTSSNKITVQNGGRLSIAQKFYMGYGVNADSNTITVDGIGSQINNTGSNSFLWLGFSGSSNKIVVSNGGYYGANGGNAGSRHYVGENMGADSNTIEVKGKGSLFETSANGWLTIGGMGSSNGMALSDGGMIWTGALGLGGVSPGVVGGSNNTITIADTGSILLTRKSLSIGRGVGSANNGITISNGGMLHGQGQFNITEAMHVVEIGASTGADNNFVVVTGAGSRWFADYGWDTNGNQGNVTNTNVGTQIGVIGYAAAASGNHVDILDGGMWVMNARLQMGGVNSKLNLGNGTGAKSYGTFKYIDMSSVSAEVVVNNGEFKFAADNGAITGLGKVRLNGPGFFTNASPATNTIETEITGAGSLTMQGTGTLTLSSGLNSYTGDTSVETGILSIKSAYLYDASALYIATGAVMNLNFGGAADTIAALYFNNVLQAAGTWGHTSSGASNINDTFFSGSGMVQVVTVPEPSTFVMLLLGSLTFWFMRRQRVAVV